MLVFLSDLHFTDTTSTPTIQAGAFKKFSRYLSDMAESACAKEIEIVLLGDIFDFLHSHIWAETTIRPWSTDEDIDTNGLNLEHYTNKIFDSILSNPTNVQSRHHLKALRQYFDEQNIKLRFRYIPGNHDRLINYYSSLRVKAAEFLSLDNPTQYETKVFETEFYFEEYSTFCRHGDIYDSINAVQASEKASIGDAIVIDLIRKFSRETSETIPHDKFPHLHKALSAIDYVRPLWDVPAWIHGACLSTGIKDFEKKIKKNWNSIVDEFLSLDFVRRHNHAFRFDPVDKVIFGLKFTQWFSIGSMAKIPFSKISILSSSLARKADQDIASIDKNIDFVVYGHTHLHKVQPIRTIYENNSARSKLYFNTGTWRSVFTRSLCDTKCSFSGWNVMTFVAFYLPDEREQRKFEIWHGALGDVNL